MKILLTSDWPISAVNGVAVSIKNLYTQLSSMGHEVKVLSLSDKDKYYKNGDFYYIKSFEVPIYPEVRGTIFFKNKFVKELIRWRPDVIHSQCEFFTYTFANIIAMASNAPVVHTYHTLYEHYSTYITPNKRLGNLIVKQLVSWRLRDADTVIAPTGKVYSKLKNQVKGKLVIMPTGIDLGIYNQEIDEEKISSIKKQYAIDKNTKIILSLGRVAKEKNFDECILNYKELLKYRNDVVFIIVGDGPYLPQLKKLVKKEGIEDKMIFTGLVKPSEAIYYYQCADLYISASVSESQGLTFIEALANGLAEICKRDDALIGVIEEGVNGYTYENTDEFVQHANRLLDDGKLLAEFSANAKKSSEKFSLENFGNNAVSIYEEAIDNFKPRRRLLPSNIITYIKKARKSIEI